eukprot:5648348-Pyramimonas_sp.AAC.1
MPAAWSARILSPQSLAHALLVPMPVLKALATPPGVLPAACSFRQRAAARAPFCQHFRPTTTPLSRARLPSATSPLR